jgi:hypothetical protein
LLVEVVNHDLGFQPDGMIVALDVVAQLLVGPADIKLRIAPRLF